MKKTLILLVAILLFTTSCVNKEKENDYLNSFYIDEPEGWITVAKSEIYDNLSNFEFTDDQLKKLMKNNNNSLLVVAYSKYKQEEYAGIIPTVQITLMPNNTNSFESFQKNILESTKTLKNYFGNFEYIDKPAVAEIDGIKSIYFKTKFDLVLEDGEVVNVRSWNYAVPYKSFFYQINFSDTFDQDDNSELFNKLIKSIKIKGNNNFANAQR